MEKLNKAEIAKQLRTMVEERLFGAKPWPIDNNYEVRQQLIDWGLVEKIGSNIHTTALGCELSVDTWSAFIGHHEPFEVPDILAQMGMITEEEADHIVLDRWERDGEKLEDILPPLLRRLYPALIDEPRNAEADLAHQVALRIFRWLPEAVS